MMRDQIMLPCISADGHWAKDHNPLFDYDSEVEGYDLDRIFSTRGFWRWRSLGIPGNVMVFCRSELPRFYLSLGPHEDFLEGHTEDFLATDIGALLLICKDIALLLALEDLEPYVQYLENIGHIWRFKHVHKG